LLSLSNSSIWNSQISEEFFIIEQIVRQGGALSADLYKVYINPLLDILSNTGLGGKIGNIYCCAPTCAVHLLDEHLAL
jgi:hypothetical protein